MKVINLRVEEALHRDLRRKAIDEGTTLQEICIRLLGGGRPMTAKQKIAAEAPRKVDLTKKADDDWPADLDFGGNDA